MEESKILENKIYRVNNNLCCFSPCGHYFAIAHQSYLIIKKNGTFDTVNVYDFSEIIEFIEWSPNAQFISSVNFKKALIGVYSINYPDWKFKLTEGSAGLEKVLWSPDSLHIITVSDFQIQISVWSLNNQSVVYIQNLKSRTNGNAVFSPNGKSLAVITTDDGTDSVEIYKTEGWKISRKLLCEKLSAIDGLSWSPNSELLCIWCSICGQSKFLIYSTLNESHVGVFHPEALNVKSVGNEVYNGPRGIDRVSWNPSGQLLAIAAFNERIVLLNYVTWKPILELRCEPIIKDSDYIGRVYKECAVDKADSAVNNVGKNEKQKMDEINERPINIPIATNLRGNMDVPSIAGIDIFKFSSCGRYLAIRHQLYSSTMWIWDISEDSVDHLLLKRPISGASWHPHSPRLVIFNESSSIFEWTSNRGSTIYRSPRGITILSGAWDPRGKILSLCGYNKTALMNLDE